MHHVYSCQLYPTPSQKTDLEQCLDVSRRLYNFMLEDCIRSYQHDKTHISEYDHNYLIAQFRSMMPSLKWMPAVIAQNVSRRLDQAFRAFFRRLRNGGTSGFPRFKGWARWHSFGFKIDCKLIHGSHVAIPKLGRIRARGLNQKIEGVLKFCRVVRRAGKWFCHIASDDGMKPPAKIQVESVVGIDVGLNKFAVFSDGTEIPNPRFVKQFARKLARAHRKITRRKKGSNNRRKAILALQKIYWRMANKRSSFTHSLSKWIADRYQFIVFEDLNISGMSRGRFSKSILDAAWAQFIHRTTFKAENAGGLVVKVNPCGTSQECSRCGKIVQKSLAVRIHNCPHCGLVMCRDQNSGINILKRGLAMFPDLLNRFGNDCGSANAPS